MRATRRVVKEFSDLLGVLTDSYHDLTGVSAEDAARIRLEWEDVKRAAERLVRACERGLFADPEPRV